MGALDLAGNLWEWTSDWYDNYPGGVSTNPDLGTTYKVLRGGSWLNTPKLLRSSNRGKGEINIPYDFYGFRCVRTS